MIDPFDGFTDQDLKTELARRNELRNAPKPQPLESAMKFRLLIQMCIEHVQRVWDEGFKDYEVDLWRDMYETALEAVYGPEIFDELNKRHNAIRR